MLQLVFSSSKKTWHLSYLECSVCNIAFLNEIFKVLGEILVKECTECELERSSAFWRYFIKRLNRIFSAQLLASKYSWMMAGIWACAGRGPDQLRGALPCDVPTWGVPLDDVKDQTHGRAVGQRHPLAGCQAEPDQAPKKEGGLT